MKQSMVFLQKLKLNGWAFIASLALLLFVGLWDTHAQGTDKKRKGSYSQRNTGGNQILIGVFVGVGKPFAAEEKDASGNPTNVFGGYGPGFMLGADALYYIGKNTALEASAGYVMFSKTNVKLSNLAINLGLKFDLFAVKHPIRPYLKCGFSLGLTSINQSTSSQEYLPPSSYSVKDGKSVPVSSITYNEPSVHLAWVPMPGFFGGAGVDIRSGRQLVFFGEVLYSQYLANSTIKQYYPENSAGLSYLGISVGVRWSLVKMRSLY